MSDALGIPVILVPTEEFRSSSAIFKMLQRSSAELKCIVVQVISLHRHVVGRSRNPRVFGGLVAEIDI